MSLQAQVHAPNRGAVPFVALAGCVMLSAGYSGNATAATLTVGTGQRYATVAAAVAASHDGDTINVLAGVYPNDFAEIRTKITLVAVGGQARMVAQGAISNGKAIFITDTDITIQGFRFSGATVTDANGANGAGIRYQGGRLTIDRCYFLNNQEGLLAASVSGGTIKITNSEFAHNGATTGPSAGYTHNLYVNNIATLDIENSYFHDANIGHEIKSRAQTTIINNTRVVDGPNGTASYSVDLPNGGLAMISNSEIEQGPHSGNPAIVSFGEEGGIYSGSKLTMTNTLIENDLSSPSVLALRNASATAAQLTGNSVYGLAPKQLATGPANVSGTQYLSTEPPIATSHPWAVQAK